VSYVQPPDLARIMIDAGESKALLSTRDTLIRAFMAGAILALAAGFAVTVTVQTGNALVGALLFPVGFAMLSLLGFDLVTGVFTLVPLAWLDKRPGVGWKALLRNWGLVFVGNFAGALVVAVLFAIMLTHGFATPPDAVGVRLGQIGVSRTVGYADFGAAGMLTLFVRAVLCNWMVSTGVVGAMLSTSVPGKVVAMWMPILVFFYMGFEHSVVNMFLFPLALIVGGDFSVGDYLVWNEIPTLIGNMVGGITFVGLTLYLTHHRTGASRRPAAPAATPGAAPGSDDVAPSRAAVGASDR
jgi:formate/nitrite transporter